MLVCFICDLSWWARKAVWSLAKDFWSLLKTPNSELNQNPSCHFWQMIDRKLRVRESEINTKFAMSAWPYKFPWRFFAYLFFSIILDLARLTRWGLRKSKRRKFWNWLSPHLVSSRNWSFGQLSSAAVTAPPFIPFCLATLSNTRNGMTSAWRHPIISSSSKCLRPGRESFGRLSRPIFTFKCNF